MTDFAEYRITVWRDGETGQVVAEVPALEIGDYGLDSEEALARLQQMAAFHLECLAAEGRQIPVEAANGEGLYMRVGSRLTASAAGATFQPISAAPSIGVPAV